MKDDSLYNTFVKGQREFHISALGLTSRLFLLSKQSKQKVKSRTVSQVNTCRVVCLSVCLAIKTPHTPVEKFLSFKKNRGPRSPLRFKMYSPSLKEEKK